MHSPKVQCRHRSLGGVLGACSTIIFSAYAFEGFTIGGGIEARLYLMDHVMSSSGF